MSAPVVTNPIGDTVLDLPQGTPSIVLSATVRSDTPPTARCWKDLGWSFYSRNVTQLPWPSAVVNNGDGTYTASETVYPPYPYPPLPSLDPAKRWFVFTNADGTATSGKLQLRTV